VDRELGNTDHELGKMDRGVGRRIENLKKWIKRYRKWVDDLKKWSEGLGRPTKNSKKVTEDLERRPKSLTWTEYTPCRETFLGVDNTEKTLENTDSTCVSDESQNPPATSPYWGVEFDSTGYPVYEKLQQLTDAELSRLSKLSYTRLFGTKGSFVSVIDSRSLHVDPIRDKKFDDAVNRLMRLLVKLDHTTMTAQMNDHKMTMAREHRITVTCKIADELRAARKYAKSVDILSHSFELIYMACIVDVTIILDKIALTAEGYEDYGLFEKVVKIHDKAHPNGKRCQESKDGLKCPGFESVQVLYWIFRQLTNAELSDLSKLVKELYVNPNIDTNRSFMARINSCPFRVDPVGDKKFDAVVNQLKRSLVELDHTIAIAQINDLNITIVRKYRIKVTCKIAGILRGTGKFIEAVGILNDSLEQLQLTYMACIVDVTMVLDELAKTQKRRSGYRLFEEVLGINNKVHPNGKRCKGGLKCPDFRSVQATNDDGRTLLCWAVMTGDKDSVKLLLKRRANVKLKQLLEEHVDIMLRLDKRVDVDEKDKSGTTALSLAVDAGKEDIVKLLLVHGANANVKPCGNLSPLCLAVKKGHKVIVGLLLDFNAVVNEECQRYGSPLRLAVEKGDEVIVNLLLKRGANLNAERQGYMLPLRLAVEKGNQVIVNLLLERGANPNAERQGYRLPLGLAVEKGHENIVLLLLEKNADVNTVDKDGWTPLSLAVNYGHEAIVELLLDRGADVNGKGNGNLTPLACAAYCGHETIIELLFRKRPNVNVQDKDGWTPLVWAAASWQKTIMKLLLQKGAVRVPYVFRLLEMSVAMEKFVTGSKLPTEKRRSNAHPAKINASTTYLRECGQPESMKSLISRWEARKLLGGWNDSKLLFEQRGPCQDMSSSKV
jgi:ankyrin repeat protein